VTHDQLEVMTRADRIVVMNDGEILQIGSPPMNFLSVTGLADRLWLADGQSLTSPRPLAIGQPLAVGIRPEAIVLADHDLRAVVAVVEPAGAETLLLVRVGKEQLNVVVRERLNIVAGPEVFLQVVANDVTLFNSESPLELLCANAWGLELVALFIRRTTRNAWRYYLSIVCFVALCVAFVML
jgi:multiple sugar transport system ATP-binding protein